MSAIERLFDTTFTVTRMDWSGDSSAEISQGTFSGHIQQMRPELAVQLGMVHTKTFLVWCAVGTNVKAGDTLEVSSGSYSGTYSVKAVQTNATGRNEHLELTIEKDIA